MQLTLKLIGIMMMMETIKNLQGGIIARIWIFQANLLKHTPKPSQQQWRHVMRFDCGETWEEKKARLSEWHSFFPLFPRRIEGHDCRCFEWIERKGRYELLGYVECGWRWEYRAIDFGEACDDT